MLQRWTRLLQAPVVVYGFARSVSAIAGTVPRSHLLPKRVTNGLSSPIESKFCDLSHR